MNCEREHELLDALTRGFVGPELETHLAACPSCNELRMVAGALLDDRADAIAAAAVPPSGAMLWRIRTRSRAEVAAKSRRWLLIGQAATLLIAVTLIALFFGAELASVARHFAPTTPLLIAFATWLLLAPIAGWVAIRQK